MIKNKYSLVVLMLVVFFFAIAGYGIAKAAYGEPEPAKNTVLIKGYQFLPAEIRIMKGESVTWINQDSVRHTATGNSFDSKLLRKGQSFTHTFNESGIFNYICTPHPSMEGKVIVR